MDPKPVDDTGLRGWLDGKRWHGYRAIVLIAWVVTVLLVALRLWTMVLTGHTSAPSFHF